MKKFFEDFKAFAMRGNVIDMAVGVIIGAAFGSITTSLVNDIFMPLIGVLTGGINFGGLFVALDGGSYVSAEAAAAAGVGTINYGLPLSKAALASIGLGRLAMNIGLVAHDSAGSRPGQAQAHLPVLQGRDCRRRDPLPALHVDAGIKD